MYASRLDGVHDFDSDEAVCILGKSFDVKNNEEKNKVFETIQSFLWVSYRDSFEPLLPSTYRSDAGWGCMIRTTQMMVGTALQRFLLPKGFVYKENSEELKESNYQTSVRVFLDHPVDTCPLSIHNLLVHAKCFNKPAGTWFAPSEACHLINSCLKSPPLQKLVPKFGSFVFNEATIFLDKLLELFETNDSVLLLIPLRLGLQEINEQYLPELRNWLNNKYCVGFVGGKPRKSLYFFGFQGEQLLYLDPHQCQTTVGIDSDVLQSSTYHFQGGCLKMDEKELDPSLALGLLAPSKDDLTEFWQTCLSLSDPETRSHPIIHCAERQPVYDFNWDTDGTEEQTDYAEDSDSDNPFIVLNKLPTRDEEGPGLFQQITNTVTEYAATATNAVGDVISTTSTTVTTAVANTGTQVAQAIQDISVQFHTTPEDSDDPHKISSNLTSDDLKAEPVRIPTPKISPRPEDSEIPTNVSIIKMNDLRDEPVSVTPPEKVETLDSENEQIQKPDICLPEAKISEPVELKIPEVISLPENFGDGKID